MTYNLIHVIQHNESTFFQAGVSLCVMFSSDIYTVIRLDCQAFLYNISCCTHLSVVFYAKFVYCVGHTVRIYNSRTNLKYSWQNSILNSRLSLRNNNNNNNNNNKHFINEVI